MKKLYGFIGSMLLVCLGLAGCGGGSGSNTQTTPIKPVPSLVSIGVAGTATSVAAGSTLQLSAKGTYSDSSTATLTSQVSWNTSDTTIATVSASGVVTGVSAGTVTVTAADGSISGKMAITVSQVTLSSIAVTGASSSPTAGTSEQLTAEGTYSDDSTQALTTQVTWQTSDNTIASIGSSGMLTAVKAGSVTITAIMGSVSGNMSIAVIASSGVNPPTLTAITVVPLSFSIASGQTKQLAALGVFSDGTSQDVTAQVSWSSSATNTVSVSTTALATGVSAGTATITATSGAISGAATANVTAATLNSIVVTPATASIATGQTQAFAANGIFSDGSSTDMTNSVSWSSSATNFATIDVTGLAKGVSAGSATISATAGTVTGSAALTVTAAVLTEVDISPDAQTIPIGGQVQLILTGSYSDGTTQTLTNVAWSSSDPTTASVDPATGIVTGVANSNGNPITISASASGMSDTTTVYVTSAVAESLTLTPATASIASGTTEQFSVNAVYSDGSTQPLTVGLSWSSSSGATAAISATGLAAGIAPGQTTITATYGTLTGTAVLTVTPAALTAIVVVPTSPTVGVNGNVQFSATGIYSDDSTQDLTSQVTWGSSAANVALISSTGLATGLSNGTTTVTATYESISGSTTLTVETPRLVSITISPANPILPTHAHLQMIAIGNFSDGSQAPLSGVYWRTSRGYAATISRSGLVSTRRTSSRPITIYAMLNGIIGQTSLTISSMTVTSLQLTPTTATIAVGTTMPFRLIGVYSDGVTKVDLTNWAWWQTSNWRNAVIFKSGVAWGWSPGTVTITANYRGLPPVTATLTVSNATIQSITVAPPNPTINLGASQQFTATGLFSDGSTQDITTVSQWSSSAPTIAIMRWWTSQAISTGHGQTNINATFHGVSGATVLNVN